MAIMAVEAVPEVAEAGAAEAGGAAGGVESSSAFEGSQFVGPSGPNTNRQQRQTSPQPSASRSTVTFKDTSYHRVVMAEYIGCMVLIATAPLVGSPKDQQGNDLDTNVALFGADALIRMTAVSVVFLILALMANHEKPGKFASAFGGLILVGLLVNTSPSFWEKIGSFFTGGVGTTPGSASSATGTPSTASGAAGAAQRAASNLGNLAKDLFDPGFFATNAAKTIGDGITSIFRAIDHAISNPPPQTSRTITGTHGGVQ